MFVWWYRCDINTTGDCMEKFCEYLKEHAMKIINYRMKRANHTNNKNIHKIRNHCHYEGKYRDAVHRICNLRYNILIYIYIYIYI